jgi:hypothetical protein
MSGVYGGHGESHWNLCEIKFDIVAEIFVKHVHIKGSDLFWFLFDTNLFFIKNWPWLYFASLCMNTHLTHCGPAI